MVFRTKRFLLLLLILLTVWSFASASTWQIDGAVGTVPDQTLSGDNEITALLLEEGITGIGTGAFSHDPALRLAVVPASVQQIGEGAFEQCGPILLQCTPGSAAMAYAQSMHLEYDAGTTRRALLIGQTNYPDPYTLSAPGNDVDALSHVLTGFEVTIARDLTADGIIEAIGDTFAPGTVKEQDISLFYYSGHGFEDASLFGIDEEFLPISSLHRALDAIPGRKILILDCCYSGSFIPRGRMFLSMDAGSTADRFNAGVIAEFGPVRSRMLRSTAAGDPREYFILTACAADELSWEARKESRRFGVFTRYLAMGLGYDEKEDVQCDLFADADHDGVITLMELYEYARDEVAVLNTPEQQNAQIYPADANDLALYRADPRTLPAKKLGVITYDACGGSNAPSRQMAVMGEPLELSSLVPTLSGHRFDGWSSTRGSTVATIRAGETMTPSGSMTLYAVWTDIDQIVPVVPKTGDNTNLPLLTVLAVLSLGVLLVMRKRGNSRVTR